MQESFCIQRFAPIGGVSRCAAMLALSAGALFSTQDSHATQPSRRGSSRTPKIEVSRAAQSTSKLRSRGTYGVLAVYQPPIPRPGRPSGNDEKEAPLQPQVEVGGSQPVVSGSRAVVRNGIAYAPSRAPEVVKRAIWAVNSLRRKPYKWGGGHRSFSDSGYDCSGTVSFALHNAGLLGMPMPSSDFLRYGERGRGQWITIYSRNGHTFAEIAGLRLDTTDTSTGADVGPRWHASSRSGSGFQVRHPEGL
jgi:cell wall-associated NlpC family hydrolase